MTPTPSSELRIVTDDVSNPAVIELLHIHAAYTAQGAPPQSIHTLSIAELKNPNVSFYSAWIGDRLAGFMGMLELDPTHAEIKSAHTVSSFRGRGIAATLVQHLLTVAAERGYSRMSLETGSDEHFLAARKLYERFDFVPAPPFGQYVEDPLSVYMTKALQE